MDDLILEHGFLPATDPATRFERYPELQVLDELGPQLPQRLEDPDFRVFVRSLNFPFWPEQNVRAETLPELRLYYVRLGFFAAGYVNQVSQPRATLLPRNIAVPLMRACRLLNRPPILSYDGYALYNWRRLDPSGPIALGNIDTLQNFVRLYDEHWFILVHVEIEAIAADIFSAIDVAAKAVAQHDGDTLDVALADIAHAVWRQVAVLRRIPEHMRPELYFRTFRPYIRFFENVVYEGVDDAPWSFRGETGAQSSIVPALVAFLKIPHQRSTLTDHLADMRRFMPAEHRRVLEELDALPPVRDLASADVFNDLLEAVAAFREVHINWAWEYINRWVTDPRGTGGTPYMTWLRQLIDETRAARKPAEARAPPILISPSRSTASTTFANREALRTLSIQETGHVHHS